MSDLRARLAEALREHQRLGKRDEWVCCCHHDFHNFRLWGARVMTGQLTLAYAATIADKFEQFHEDNPKVYTTLVRLAREWVERTGRKKLGIKTLYERARWEIALATTDPDFKLNNSYTAFYARLIMAQERDLAGLFDLRASEADDWISKEIAG